MKKLHTIQTPKIKRGVALLSGLATLLLFILSAFAMTVSADTAGYNVSANLYVDGVSIENRSRYFNLLSDGGHITIPFDSSVSSLNFVEIRHNIPGASVSFRNGNLEITEPSGYLGYEFASSYSVDIIYYSDDGRFNFDGTVTDAGIFNNSDFHMNLDLDDYVNGKLFVFVPSRFSYHDQNYKYTFALDKVYVNPSFYTYTITPYNSHSFSGYPGYSTYYFSEYCNKSVFDSYELSLLTISSAHPTVMDVPFTISYRLVSAELLKEPPVIPSDPGDMEIPSGYESVKDFLFHLFLAPVTIVSSFLNFEIFGTNVWALFSFVLTMLIGFFLAKMILSFIFG